MFIPVEALIWIRSLAIVLLIVAHALRHVQLEPEQTAPIAASAPQPAPLVLAPELVEVLRAALAHVAVSEDPQTPQALPSPQGEQRANNYERVKTYLTAHPQATDRAIADALTISASTANKWRKRIERENLEGERREQCA